MAAFIKKSILLTSIYFSISSLSFAMVVPADDEDRMTARQRNRLPRIIEINHGGLHYFLENYRAYLPQDANPQNIEDAVRLLAPEGVRAVWAQEELAELSPNSSDSD